ncbi:hypothetical protein [Chryseolinea soli]|nr:hypothetical protein [Chryseolinea soli]
MKRSSSLVMLLTVAALAMIACEDVVVKDISDREVVLLSPQDSATFNSASYTFWWNPVESADGYQLLIVSPDLQQPAFVALDTTITKDKFTIDLANGQYQWCVRAVNSSYTTAYTCRVVTIKK